MIKDQGTIREPRGLSWQNWTTLYKDNASHRRKYLVIGMVVLCAVLLAALFLKLHTGTNYAKQTTTPSTSGQHLNLNDTPQPSTPTEAAHATPTNPAPISDKPDPTNESAAKIVAPLKKISSCDYPAMANAKLTYSTNLAAENAYHTAQLGVLQTTGVVSSLLNSSASSEWITKENSRHESKLTALQDMLETALTQADCQ